MNRIKRAWLLIVTAFIISVGGTAPIFLTEIGPMNIKIGTAVAAYLASAILVQEADLWSVSPDG